MLVAVSVFLVLFCALGVFDGWYFHLRKFKLHLVPAARREHLIHTLRAFVFVPIALLLYVFNSAGWLLYAALFFVLADLVLEVIDVLEERRARAPLGGTPPEESAIHIFASCFKFTAVVVLCLAKSPEAYSFSSAPLLPELLPLHLMMIGFGFAAGCLIGGIHSLVLAGYDLTFLCRHFAFPCPLRGKCVRSAFLMSALALPPMAVATYYACGGCCS